MGLIGLAHRLVAHPRVYDVVQAVFGREIIHRRFARAASICRAGDTIVDIGGGTGLLRPLCPEQCRYLCIDNEEPKIRGFQQKGLDGDAVIGDATRLPVRTAAADVVLMVAMAHHLSNESLARALGEARRALKASGSLLILEPVVAPFYVPGRILWALDRGAYPRRPEQLMAIVRDYFEVTSVERFTLFHEYLICVAAVGSHEKLPAAAKA
jgi:SAM-dependent methyltransferase